MSPRKRQRPSPAQSSAKVDTKKKRKKPTLDAAAKARKAAYERQRRANLTNYDKLAQFSLDSGDLIWLVRGRRDKEPEYWTSVPPSEDWPPSTEHVLEHGVPAKDPFSRLEKKEKKKKKQSRRKGASLTLSEPTATPVKSSISATKAKAGIEMCSSVLRWLEKQQLRASYVQLFLLEI